MADDLHDLLTAVGAQIEDPPHDQLVVAVCLQIEAEPTGARVAPRWNA